MTYTVLDLEWDSAYFVSEKRFINQILQIGAVKLDENFNIVDTFERTVKSSFSKRVTGRFTALTGITTADMRAGVSLETAVKEYNDWLDGDTVTMTWSNSDLYTVIENEKTLLCGLRFKIKKYLDLQSFVQNEMRLMGFEVLSQISLSDAANKLGIVIDGYDMHTAKDDSTVCALMLKKLYNKERFEALVKDTSDNGFFERISYKAHFVKDINDECVDKSQLEFFCPECKGKLIRKSNWKLINNNFFSVHYCENCKKKYKARISFKKTFDGVIVKKRVSILVKKAPEKTQGEQKNELQPLSEKV